MEKVKSICVMCELSRAMADLERQLESRFGLTFNEAMVLCCIGRDDVMASYVSENTGLTPSNTSKVLRSIETKGLVLRALGAVDRRQMHFSLTADGLQRLRRLKDESVDIPEFIIPLFD